MKKMLFLYPIEEYMNSVFKDKLEMYDALNKTIDERYRKNGYQVVYTTFKGKSVFGVNVSENDEIIEADLTFEEHTTPIGKDENNRNIYKYNNNEYLQNLLGDFEELVVCGFHAQDCVMRTAEHFYDINKLTMIDEELTDFFEPLSKRFYFDKEKYNLANKIIYDKAEDIVENGRNTFTEFSYYKERYTKPYFHLEKFNSDFTLEECVSKLRQVEEEEHTDI